MGKGKRSGSGLGLRFVLLGGVVLAIALALVGWNRVAASPRLCSTCHAMDDAAASAARSVHADVPCLACHTKPGLVGALRYVPSLARETVATVTGWDVAHGVLSSAPCTKCHADLATSPALKAAHTGPASGDCASCHGEVAHPQLALVSARPAPAASGAPHPQDYTKIHGADAIANPATCNTCHQPDFCEACHFQSTFPHPNDWITKHGSVEEQKGVDACTLCHPSTFCVGCHGTEIPHQPTWLDEHWRALQDASVTPCLVCHAKTDCTTCHSEHGIHREQGLFRREGT